jgi:hypothetical protein
MNVLMTKRRRDSAGSNAFNDELSTTKPAQERWLMALHLRRQKVDTFSDSKQQ